jgi:hypothetical protein
MKASRSSRHRRPPTAQLSLPLQASRIATLDTSERAGVIALLARLLVEAARPAREPEGSHDAS